LRFCALNKWVFAVRRLLALGSLGILLGVLLAAVALPLAETFRLRWRCGHVYS
jgi:hypothetical protein